MCHNIEVCIIHTYNIIKISESTHVQIYIWKLSATIRAYLVRATIIDITVFESFSGSMEIKLLWK